MPTPLEFMAAMLPMMPGAVTEVTGSRPSVGACTTVCATSCSTLAVASWKSRAYSAPSEPLVMLPTTQKASQAAGGETEPGVRWRRAMRAAASRCCGACRATAVSRKVAKRWGRRVEKAVADRKSRP